MALYYVLIVNKELINKTETPITKLIDLSYLISLRNPLGHSLPLSQNTCQVLLDPNNFFTTFLDIRSLIASSGITLYHTIT